ncbi:hypothetical protein Aduo_014570 [Ancylostoma duodenale]
MDLDVHLDLNVSSSEAASLHPIRRTSIQFERTGPSLPTAPVVSSTPGSSLPVTGRKRQVGRRSSLNSDSSSSKHTGEAGEEGNDKSSASEKRRRKSRQLPHEVQDYNGSSLFTKPISSTRPRHLISRRYSPSPDTRPGAKLKSLVAKIQGERGKPGKKRLEFTLTKLPKEFDSTSCILLEGLQCDPADFELCKEIEKEKTVVVIPAVEPQISKPPTVIPVQPPTAPTVQATTASTPAPTPKTSQDSVVVVKEEVLSVNSSNEIDDGDDGNDDDDDYVDDDDDDDDDDDEDYEPEEPVVRMADIGAAPFTSAPNLPLPALVARPKRRFKVSTPVIKLPKRRTLDVGSGLDVSERSSIASASSVENVTRVKQVRRRRTIDDVDKSLRIDSSPAKVDLPVEVLPTSVKRGRRRTVVAMAGDIDRSLPESISLGHSTSKPVKVAAEKKSEQSTSQSSVIPKKDVVRRKGKRARASGSIEGEKGPPAKTMAKTDIKDIGPAPVADRPKRLSAGKTLDFLAEVTKSRRSSVGRRSRANPSTVAETSSCSTPEDAPATSSKESESPNVLPAAPAHPTSLPKQEVPEKEVKQDASPSIAERVVDQEVSNDTMEQDTGSDTSYSPSSASGSVDSAEGDKATEVKHSTRSSSKEDKGPEQKNITPEVKITRSKPHSVSVKAAGAGKVRISSALVEGASLASTSKHTPALLSIRRSSRSHTLTKKMRDSDLHTKTSGSSTPTISKPVDPNSALGILQRVSRFTRPIRSPSPQPLRAFFPRGQERSAASALEQQSETPTEVESPASRDTGSSASAEASNDSTVVEAVAKAEAVEKDPVLGGATSSDHSVKPPILDAKEGSSSTPQHSSKVTRGDDGMVPSTSSGRSSRVVRPSSRFINADFVSPTRRRRGSKSTVADPESGKEKDSPALTSPKAEVVSSPMDEVKPAGEVDTTLQAAQDPAEVVPPETSSNPAPVVTPVHTMETRRRSLGKKARPIKIKLRLGCFPRVIAVNAGNENKTEEPESSKPAVQEAPVVKKAPAKKYISPWSRYIPSVKPVLGNIYYSDGTVEKLGVSVNAVMDRLLAEVCKDGITRHSAIVNKREKKKRNIEKARERVARLKEEKAAREAQGWVIRHNKSSAHPEPRVESPSNELGPRVRVRAGILQKDFLYPSLKRGTKAEKKKSEELRRARSRRVMSQLAESTYEEVERPILARRGSAPSKADPGRMVRPRSPSPFDPEKQERLRLEAEERERQKRLTMPISFNTFLSSKTSVLSAQPLLQPQRISDRAPVADHFYRELLCEYNCVGEPVEDSWTDFDMDVEDCLDVTTIEAVHIPKFDDYVAPPLLDESAEPVAAEVEQMLLRPSLYAEEDGISFLYERALEQPELRRNLLSMAIECISALHVARLSACGREAAIVVYNTVTHQASKMRDVICMFSREREEAVFWMHRYLIEMLPVELLASYLFLLRHTRLLNCQVKSIVRSTQNESSPWPEVTRIIGKYVEVNVVEPDAADLDRTIAPASLSDVVFILVAPNISVGDFSVRDRFHDSVYKWLREIGHPASSIVKIKIDEPFSTAVSEMVYTAVNMISRVITKMVREHRQKRIVLVGWGTTCVFNHMALSAVPGVSAIIDLAFPILTLDGPRGEPDDDILLTYCPSLFVVGSQACDYHPGAMKMMRSSMIMPSGLVVIGHANNNLLVSCTTLSRLRITQRAISRCIVEQISDFLGMEWTKRERSRLVPMPLNDTFKVDLTQLKIDERAAQASRKPRDDGAVRKKKLSGTPLQSPIPREASPSPLPVTQLDSVRSNFQSLLKKVGADKVAKWPEERQLLPSAFKEPRLPVKPVSEMASPVPRSDSPNLLDPASISLI